MDVIEQKVLEQDMKPLPPMPLIRPNAMAYVMFQPENAPLYSPANGIEAGTMFPDLDKPFLGKYAGDAK